MKIQNPLSVLHSKCLELMPTGFPGKRGRGGVVGENAEVSN